jgi:hypothetical protein
LSVVPAESRLQIERHFRFARQVYREDPNWVEPILRQRLDKVDAERNAFWRAAEGRLWTAERSGAAVGTITRPARKCGGRSRRPRTRPLAEQTSRNPEAGGPPSPERHVPEATGHP